jgi:mycothiol synthase
VRTEARRQLSRDELDAVTRLLDAAELADGRHPLSERKWMDLVEEGPEGLATVLATDDSGGAPVGLAQVSGHDGEYGVELVVHPDQRAHFTEVGHALVRSAVEAVAAAGGGELHVWVTDAGAGVEEVARNAGMRPGRELHQLRRSLPVGHEFDLTTRGFVRGQDEAAWLEVNNRAFAGHPEQGGWTLETLLAREREPWFDSEGFRLHERDGRLAGFCWTKVHRDHDPPLGEIYVIGVDPDFQRHGIGRPLVLAGLDWLASQRLTVGMLYVDSANRSAVQLYDRLGFTSHHVDRAFVVDVPPVR